MSDPAGPATAPAAHEALASRLLHMLLFAVVFWVLCWVVGITAIVQLALRAFGGAPSAELQRFGANLGRLAAQVIAYLSFASDALPFPLGPFPQDEPAVDATGSGPGPVAR